MSSVIRRVWAVSLTVLVICLVGATPPASGHAVLLASLPVDGSTVDTPPSQLSLQFDEDVHVGSTAFHLFDGSGTPVDLPPARSLAAPAAADATVVGVPLPPLARGRYLVRWQSITSDDFHPVSGSFTFGIGVAAGADAGGSSVDRALGAPLESLVRTVAIIGYAVLAGSLVLLLLLHAMLGAAPRTRARIGRSASVGLGAAVGGLAALAALLVVGSGAPPPSSFLVSWVLAVGCLVVAGACSRRLARSPLVSRPTAAAGAVGLVSLVGAAYGIGHLGHGAASSGSVLSTLHVVATSVWTGGAAVVAVVVLADRRSAEVDGRAVMRRFGVVAIPAILLSAFTGFLLARPLVPASDGLEATGYGRGLLLKLALVAVAVALGGLAFRAARSENATRHGARLVVELTVMVGVLAIAASMSAGQPPDDRHWQPTPSEPATAGLLAADVDDLVLTLTLGPGAPGSNFATVGVLDTRRPTPAQVSAVLVDLGESAQVAAVLQRDGDTTQSFPGASPNTTWVASGTITSSGRHDIRVTVRRVGLPDAVATFPWQVAPAPGSEVGGAELSGMWTMLAAGVVAVALLVLALALLLRRRRAASGVPSGQPVPDERLAEQSLV